MVPGIGIKREQLILTGGCEIVRDGLDMWDLNMKSSRSSGIDGVEWCWI